MIISSNGNVLYLERLEIYKYKKPYKVIFDLAEFGDGTKQTNCHF